VPGICEAGPKGALDQIKSALDTIEITNQPRGFLSNKQRDLVLYFVGINGLWRWP